jgi:valyl-tRNA synthetase
MIMMGLKFTGDVPFREVYIHGLVRDAEGNKMSKSKGNVLDPLDLIDGVDLETLVQKRTTGLMQPEMAPRIERSTRDQFPTGIQPYGTDALRFTFAALASTGRDIRFDTGRIEGYRNFCNKLWNATRYVLMNTEEKDVGLNNENIDLSLADKWIISQLQKVEKEVTTHFETYRFDLAAQTIYEFVWNEYCDWYLEFSKPVLTGNASETLQRGTRRTLVRVLETILRLLHPIMPFITEELWQKVAPLAGKEGSTIMLQPYPQFEETKVDLNAETEIAWVKEVILGIRRIRSEMNISPAKQLSVLVQNGSESDLQKLQNNQSFISTLSRLQNIELLDSNATPPESAITLVSEMKILIPLAGLIDKEAELKRLNKEIDKVRKEHDKLSSKLENPNFIEKAPVELVEKEKQRVAELQAALAKLETQAVKIAGL